MMPPDNPNLAAAQDGATPAGRRAVSPCYLSGAVPRALGSLVSVSAIVAQTTVAWGLSPISEGHGATTCFFIFGQADTDFNVTVPPRLVAVSEGGTTEVRLEVSQ